MNKCTHKEELVPYCALCEKRSKLINELIQASEAMLQEYDQCAEDKAYMDLAFVIEKVKFFNENR